MKAILIGFVTFLSLATAQTGQGVNFYSIEKEIALGRSLAVEVERQTPLLEDASVQTYVAELGARLVAKLPADAPAFPYIFRVTAGDGAALEPTTLPGGLVYVPAALVQQTANENELAGLLAHAIAHAAARHLTRQETRGQIANYATLPMIFMGRGWADYANRQASQTVIPLGFLKFARTYELDADRDAVALAAASGYDPSALLAFVERSQQDRPETNAAYFSAFPSRTARLENLRAAIAALPTPAAQK